MSNTWILVADAARARLFELTRKGADPAEIACYSYPEGRSPGREQDHDGCLAYRKATAPAAMPSSRGPRCAISMRIGSPIP